MVTRPSHVLPTELDVRDPNFPRDSMEWTTHMRWEMNELVALAKKSITESRTLIAEADRVLGQR
jgi:hypothetical protein